MNNTQSIETKKDNSRTIRNALYANALFSGVSGGIGIIASGLLAEFTGINNPIVFIVLGIVLLLYAADLIWVASRETVNRGFVLVIILLDCAWVIGSIAILLTGWPALTTAGKWTVALLAEVVAIMAVLQIIGLRKLN